MVISRKAGKEVRDVAIAPCYAEDFASIVTMIDHEFIFNKGRRLSLTERFPQVVGQHSLNNIYVARLKDEIVATVAVKRFDWFAENHNWKGAMIGMVYTRPEYRGQGFASCVMRFVQEELKQRGIDFAVLWTGSPGFYERLGWYMEDCGGFGEVMQSYPTNRDHCTTLCSLSESNIDWINSVRDKWATERVIRSKMDYRTIPVPANSVDVFMLDENQKVQGYILVGRAEECSYIYEMIGHPAAFNQLWSSVTRSCNKIYINDRRGSSSSDWLNSYCNINWDFRKQAMWLAFSEESQPVLIGKWYIPYYDRI
jgi:predicted N-acetyltransferase YhbS